MSTPGSPTERERAGEAPLLSCRGVDMAYGAVQILFGVDFDVYAGELVALLGTNGAGKSTLLKGISGLVRPRGGTIRFAGRELRGMSGDEVARAGVGLMPGGKAVFPTLTVRENLRLAAWLIRRDPERVDRAREAALDLFPVLRRRADQLAGDLSGGEQQMLALAGSMMTQPRLLLLDELSLGLAPAVVAELLEVVREIHERGTTIVIVEQSVNVALGVARRAVFMEKGQVRFSGGTAELLARPDLLMSAFIRDAGDAVAARGQEPPHVRGPASPAPGATTAPAGNGRPVEAGPSPTPALSCESVVKRFGGITAVDDVDLSVRRGEIVGLIGHNGAGKTTLLDCLSGFHVLDSGWVRLDGRDATELPAHRRAGLGLGRSFQDAKLFPTLSVLETIAVFRERHLACRDMLAAALSLPASYESELQVFSGVEDLIELMNLGDYRNKLVGELSTGTRRVVDLACILAQEPPVLLLDEPSAGLAQRETEALGPLLRQVCDTTGCATVVIEHDMPLLRSMCDRMLALELGAVIAEGEPADVLAHPEVVRSYLGSDEGTIARSGALS